MIFDRLRATLRDPLYRCECRQARFWKTAGSWLLSLAVIGPLVLVCALPLACCCILTTPAASAPLYLVCSLPAFLGAESVLAERERDTLEGLLLTTADRERVAWAKVLAWLRPLFWLSAALGALAAVALPLVAALRGGGPFGTVATGALALCAGALGGLLLAGQCLACGALGFQAALLGGTRIRSYFYAMLMVLALGFVDAAVLGVASAAVAVPIMAWKDIPVNARTSDLEQMLLQPAMLGAGVLVGVVAYLARLALLAWLLPSQVLKYAARRMDERLLRDG